MQHLHVREEDLEEFFTRASGPGGQRVNKVATCVVIRHRPSGLEVRCQRERSQAINRYLARRLLLERLESERLKQLKAVAKERARRRNQLHRRSLQAKEKIVASKRLHAKKKALRRSTHDLG